LSNSDAEGSDSEEAIRKKATKKIKGVMESSDEEEGSDDEGSESENDEDVLKMDFEDESKPGVKKDTKAQKKGIMGLKFMELAQEKEKAKLKTQADLLVKQINGVDDYQDLEGDSQSDDGFINTKDKFGIKPIKPA
jgi:U3 small nucleolar RNA-associated protein 14